MDKVFFSSSEVAALLRVSVKTLRNRAAGHEVFRPCRPGLYLRGQVEVLVKVWAGALTPEEGLAEWTLEKRRMRPELASSATAGEQAKKSKNQR